MSELVDWVVGKGGKGIVQSKRKVVDLRIGKQFALLCFALLCLT